MNSAANKDLNYYMNLHYTVVLRDDDEGDVVATIQELPGCMAHGNDASEAWQRIHDVQKVWIEECLESGDPIPEPEPAEELPSGKWVQRVPRSLHKRLADRARKEGVSLNQLVATLLSQGLEARAWTDYVAVSMSSLHPAEPHGWGLVWYAGINWEGDWYRKMQGRYYGTGEILTQLEHVRKLIPSHHESTDDYDPKKGYTPSEADAR